MTMANSMATPVDHRKLEVFMRKVIGDLSGAMITMLNGVGLRLGLYDALARGPVTPGELALRAGISERYALEFLRAVRAAGYVEHEPNTDRYELPVEHAEALAREGGPNDVGGFLLWVPQAASMCSAVEQAFRDGSGIHPVRYPAGIWEAMERLSGSFYENFLVSNWIAALPELEAKLKRGALVADVGCGAARALIKLARAFPSSRFVGFDMTDAQLERARENVKKAGLSERIELVQGDAARGISGRYDLITTFDVLHDAPNPRALLEQISKGLAPDGVYLCLEMNSSDTSEANVGPLAAALYSVSIFYCMSTSLAHGGPGLGACGVPQKKLEELCGVAGLGRPTRIFEDPFSVVYAIRPGR
jgi:SAM-dependent methyltransferase